MNWEPAHADHSIESVNAVLSLTTPIDQNVFDEVLVAGRKAANAHQFTNRVEGIEPLQLNGPPGAEVVIDLANAQMRRRVGFQRIVDGAPVGEFAIGLTSVTLTSSNYSSWTHFLGMMVDLLTPIDALAGVFSQTRSLQLQYIDRFVSTAPEASAFEVVSPSSRFLASTMGEAKSAFHSHIGWFDYRNEGARRLTNINIDLIDNLPGPSGVHSRLGILTMARFESLQVPIEKPLDELSNVHYYLKKLFQDIITTDAADRVHLND